MTNFFKFTLAFIVAVLAFTAGGALAAQPGAIDGQVSWAWGDQLALIITDQIGWAATALVGALIHFAPGGTRQLIYMFRVDQLLEKAIRAAINKTAGAVQGKVLNAQVGNVVIERALEYIIFHAPKLYNTNTVQMWRDKIIARMNLAEDVAADAVMANYVDPQRG